MQKTKEPKGGKIDILNGPLGKNIFLFSIPLAITGILQQLFNAADIAVVGRFVGKNAMAAVGSNSAIIGLLVNLFVGISLGTNVVIAGFTGMKKWDSVRKTVDVSIIVAIVCGFFATIFGEIIAHPLLKLMSVPEDVFGMAEAYLRIYLAGVPVILLYNFEAAIFRSQGDSVTPLICLTISGVINVILNLFFVIILKMTADGVALATVVSNLFSAVILFVLLTRSDKPVGIHKHKIEIDKIILKKIFMIGLPAGIQSAMFSISNMCVQSAINELGADVMAASAAAFNIEILAYYILNAFGQACTTFIGQNNGAGNKKRCRMIMWQCLLQDIVLTTTACALFLIAGVPLLSIFNTDAIVLKYGYIRLKYILIGEGLNVTIEILSGALRGYGYSLAPALIALFGICGVRVVWIYTIFPMNKSFNTLLWCYPISWAFTVVALIFAYVYYLKKITNRGLE